MTGSGAPAGAATARKRALPAGAPFPFQHIVCLAIEHVVAATRHAVRNDALLLLGTLQRAMTGAAEAAERTADGGTFADADTADQRAGNHAEQRAGTRTDQCVFGGFTRRADLV